MKRRNDFSQSFSSSQRKDNHVCNLRYKKEKTALRHEPPLYIENAMPMEPWVLILIQSEVLGVVDPDTLMKIDEVSYLTFIIFLGAQGKEYIADIRNMFPQIPASLIFISLNINARNVNDRQIYFIENVNCKILAAYFDILDPLGGGVYPLDYLIVADRDMKVRCKVPIQICESRQGHQKFCIGLTQLKGFLDEYLVYLSGNLVDIQ